MEQRQLHDTLAQLHTEIGQTESVDEDTREMLRHLMSDIQALLEQPASEPDGDSATRYGPLTRRLRTAVAEFEADHPRLTASMERAIDALVQMGV
jgi:hypothetical protein